MDNERLDLPSLYAGVTVLVLVCVVAIALLGLLLVEAFQ